MGVSEQSPSVGRIVHYRLTEHDVNDIFVAHGTATGRYEIGDVLPAQIIRVYDEGRHIDLSVNLGGALLLRHAVTELPGGDDGTGQWFWPPRAGS